MDFSQRKAVRKTIYAFLMFLAIRLVEELLIVARFHLNTKGLISCVAGIVILLVYIRFDNKALDEIGLLFSMKKIGKGFLFAFLLNAVAAAVTFAFAYWKASQSGYARITFFYDDVANAYSAGLRTFLFWAGFALVVALFHAVFYELSFRGLFITIGSRTLTFGTVNALQSALYAVWFAIPILRILIYQTSSMNADGYLKLTAFMIAYEFITAAKLGLLRRTTGSLWVCIFDHVAFSFLLDMVHVQLTTSAPTVRVLNDPNYYAQMLLYQVLSLVICFVWSIPRSKKMKEQLRETAIKTSGKDA